MTALGLGCAKTPALAPHVEISLSNCISESQIILHTRGWTPCWRIVFSTFRGCMSFYTARVKSGKLDLSIRCPLYPLMCCKTLRCDAKEQLSNPTERRFESILRARARP